MYSEGFRSAGGLSDRGSYWLVFMLVALFTVAGQLFWVMPLFAWSPGSNSLLLNVLIGGIGLIAIAAIQVWVAPKVFPLFYIIPMANMLGLQAMASMGSWSAPGFFSVILALVAANLFALALCWNEATLSTSSVTAEPWLSLAPISSLLALASATVLRYMISPGGQFAVDPLMFGPLIWLVTAMAVIALFETDGRTQAESAEGEAFSLVLFVCVVLTAVVGPIAFVVLGFNVIFGWILVSLGLAEFGIASARFDSLVKHEIGRYATLAAFIVGYSMMIASTILAASLSTRVLAVP